jgi:glycosyltransferase involved in cell wall biosynthesis
VQLFATSHDLGEQKRTQTATKAVRVLYSFPHKLGADRICYTALQQVKGLHSAGAEVFVCPGVLQARLPEGVRAWPTLAWGKLRISYKLVGTMRACALHDWIVSRRLEKLAGEIDLVHTWPLAASETLKTASRLGIPTVLERPNAHTRFAYQTVQDECERLGVDLPANHEHAFKPDVLEREEEEYQLAYRILCPSEFVVGTFLDRGFAKEKLARHIYGFDEERFYPDLGPRKSTPGLKVLFVGVCAIRKGLHYALEAWLRSSAHREGEFLIAGSFVPEYARKLSTMLDHPSVRVLGHRRDVPELMRKSDILVLPTIEEGSALVTAEARGSGCVLLVSEAAGANCTHEVDSLVHPVGDMEALVRHMNRLDADRFLLSNLRERSIQTSHEITWAAAGRKLVATYQATIDSHHHVS